MEPFKPFTSDAGKLQERLKMLSLERRQLAEENRRMRKVGNNLAIAAMKVIRDYDGLHRLSLAVSEWNKAIANEGGRPHKKNKD